MVETMHDRKTCRYHPDAEAKVFCGKHEWGYCEECLASCRACTDPELYCRHRTACVIWELCRKALRERKRGGEGSECSES
jgi:hypothetical protein